MKKPSFPGTVRGQAISRKTKSPKSSRVQIKKKNEHEEEEQVTIYVRHNIEVVEWIWDGMEWVTPDVFKAQKPTGKIFDLGGKFPSKNDFDASGNPRFKIKRE